MRVIRHSMTRVWSRRLAAALFGVGLLGAGSGLEAQINTRTTLERDFLGYGQAVEYRNYAFDAYTPSPIFGWETPRYDRLGNYLMQGRVAMAADEQRPGLSRIDGLKHEAYYEVGAVFNYAVLRDSYMGASYSLLILMGNDVFQAEPVKTRFSPLTLNMTRFTGVRLDVNGPKNKASFLYSKGAGDRKRFSFFTMGRQEQSPVILWGGHWDTQVGGALRLGSTFVNQHILDATSGEGSVFRGDVPYDMKPPTYIVVRVVDDSPEDATSPVAVYDMSVVVRGTDENGETRTFTGDPELASAQVELDPGLTADLLEGRRVGDHLEAAGADEMVEYSFTMPAGFSPSRADFTATVGGDYRIQVRQEHVHTYIHSITKREVNKDHIWPSEPRPAAFEQASFSSGISLRYPVDFKFPEKVPAYTVVRSDGIGRNLEPRQVRFEYGIPTAQTLASVDLHFDYAGWEVDGELAANVQDFKFPVQQGRRERKEAMAYWLTAKRSLPTLGSARPTLGLELFRLAPDYGGNYDARRGGAVFFTGVPVAPPNTSITQEFDLFDDNDDGDQWPDEFPDDTGLSEVKDAGVYPGLDENGDNIPDTDQNSNSIPDWDEPFLFFWGDPPQFIYDIDMNNNGLPDLTENDDEPDYPYRRDQRGYHGFLKLDSPLPHVSRFGVGLYRSEQIAGGGEAKSIYVRFQADGAPNAASHLAIKADAKRVEDSIPDPSYIWKTSTNLWINQNVIQDTLSGTFSLRDVVGPDPDRMAMRNSTVGTLHLDADLNFRNSVNVRLRQKLLVNRQHDDEFADGTVQEGNTRSRLTLSSRVEYRRTLRKVSVFARAKHLYWRDNGYPKPARQHWSTFGPIFEASLPLTEKSALVAGQEGVPKLLAIHHRDHHDESQDFDRWTSVFMVRTVGNYIGWRVATEVGLQITRLETAGLDVSNRTFFVESFFGW